MNCLKKKRIVIAIKFLSKRSFQRLERRVAFFKTDFMATFYKIDKCDWLSYKHLEKYQKWKVEVAYINWFIRINGVNEKIKWEIRLINQTPNTIPSL